MAGIHCIIKWCQLPYLEKKPKQTHNFFLRKTLHNSFIYAWAVREIRPYGYNALRTVLHHLCLPHRGDGGGKFTQLLFDVHNKALAKHKVWLAVWLDVFSLWVERCGTLGTRQKGCTCYRRQNCSHNRSWFSGSCGIWISQALLFCVDLIQLITWVQIFFFLIVSSLALHLVGFFKNRNKFQPCNFK